MAAVESDAEKINILSHLGVREILARLKGVVTLTREERQSKELLLTRIVRDAPHEHLHFLLEAGHEKSVGRAGRTQGHSRQKRKRDEEDHVRRTAQRLEEAEETMDVDLDEDFKLSEFLKLPGKEEVKNCYAQFYQATSNASVEVGVCAICAQECNVIEDKLSTLPLSELPNSSRLVPTKQHMAHQLFNGRLLEPAGVKPRDGGALVSICRSCLEDLKKPNKKPPKYSLANRLWIGPIPWQLQVLTFPEQLLIALLYPRVYVFKLFPKCHQGARNISRLQRAMRGNVSTYELNAEGIASMVEGKLMPRPPAILASLISVTFIALGELPRNWIHSTFRVRRQVMFEALRWLKENNQKYYGDIDISTPRIKSLPEDDVPEEITSILRQSEDVGVIDKESEGYIPQDNNKG